MKRFILFTVTFLFLCGCEVPFGLMPDIIADDANNAQLVFFSPENDAQNIHGKIPVTFLWDKPVFKLQNPSVTQRFFEKNITITPAIEGSWQMLGTTGILFEPKLEWIGATHYEFTFTNTLLTQEIAYGFTTAKLQIQDIFAEDLIDRRPLKIQFSEEMSLMEVSKSFITPEMIFDVSYGEKIELNNHNEEETISDLKTIVFTPKTDWKNQTKYEFTLPAGITTLHGNIPSDEILSRVFETIAPFSITKIDTPENVFGGIHFTFSTPITVSEFFDNITCLAPDTEKGAQYLATQKSRIEEYTKNESTGQNDFWLGVPGDNWIPNKDYTFTMSKDVTDIYGRQLTEDKSFTFSTLFNDTVQPIYFPQNKTNVFRHGVNPIFSLWHTGSQSDVNIILTQILPDNTHISSTLGWDSDYTKLTIEEFNVAEIANGKMLDKNKNLMPGEYSFTIFFKNDIRSSSDANYETQKQNFTTRFVVTDFPIEIKYQANNDAIVYLRTFPDSDQKFSDKKAAVDIYTKVPSGETNHVIITPSENSFAITNVSAYDTLIVVEKDGLIGLGSTNFDDGISPYDAPVDYSPYSYTENLRSIAFTDRPLFKPGDRVYFKSILRNTQFGGKNFILQDVREEAQSLAQINIFDSQYNNIYSSSIPFSGGNFDGFWDIPKDAPLGYYSINFQVQEHYYETNFFVTEYRKPDFLIESTFSAEQALWKENLTAKVSAEYSFGGGLADKEVEYHISLFGQKKNNWFWENNTSRDKQIVSGSAKLNHLGELEIPINLDIELDEDIEWSLLNFQSTIHSSDAEESTQTVSIPFFISENKITLDSARSFYQASETEEITLNGKITNLSDEILKNKSLSLELAKINWVRNDRKGGDGDYVGEWRRDLTVISTKKIKSDAEGKFSEIVTLPKESNEYKLTVNSLDNKKRKASTSQSFWVWGNGQNSNYSVRGNDINRILPLYPDEQNYTIGETVSVLFPFNEWKITRAHGTIERDSVLEELTVDLEKQSITFPVEDWMTPNIIVSLLIEGIDENGNPQIRWGATNIAINDPSHTLDISLTPDRKEYQPRDTVKMKIQTNSLETGKSSEVTIAVVDQTLLALKARPALNLWQHFLQQVSLGVHTTHSLANFISQTDLNEIYAKVEQIKAMGSDSFGGGGGNTKGTDFKARGDFRDTAAFFASVKTDENGFAEIEFPLPDNATTWNIWAVGASNDNAFGEAETKIKTTLPLVIAPSAPNFFRAGDETQIGLLIRRNTNEKEEVTIKINAPELLEIQNNEKKITMKEEARVYFDVTVPYNTDQTSVDGQDVTFSLDVIAASGAHDKVELTRRILPPVMTISAAEFISVTDPITVAIKTDTQSLQSTLKTSVFRTLLDRLKTFVTIAFDNNYRCAEQEFTYWTTRLLQAEINESLNHDIEQIPVPEITKVRDHIVQLQKEGTGFKFWENSYQPNAWLTAHILDFAPVWENHEFAIPSENIRSAQSWLRQEVLTTCDWKKEEGCMSEATRQYAAFVLTRDNEISTKEFGNDGLEFLSKFTTSLEAKVWFIRTTELIGENQLSSEVSKKRDELIIELRQLLRARDRYVFWEESDRSFYSQNERLTAIIFDWLQDANELESYQPKVARYLAESKNISGNTALIIMRTLKNYAEKTEESSDTKVSYEITSNKNRLWDGELETATENQQYSSPLKPDQDFNIEFRSSDNAQYYADIELEEVLPAKSMSPVTKGFWIERNIFSLDDEFLESPLDELKSGKNYLVQVRIVSNTEHRQIIIEDTIPTGSEGVNLELDNVDHSLETLIEDDKNTSWWDSPIIDHKEFYFDKVRFFIPQLNAGVHDFKYIVKARIPGSYEQLPPLVKEMYYPEVFATGQGKRIEIIE